MKFDLFNKRKLTEARTKIGALESMASVVQKSKDVSTSVTVFIDPDFKIRVESHVNMDMANKLVEEGYIDAKQTEDAEAHHIAYVLLANEALQQLVEQYVGEPIDKKELEEKE